MEQELRFGLDLGRLALLKKKDIWADYEQLLRPVFFMGQRKKKKKKHFSVRTKKLHTMKLKSFFFLRN